MKLLRQRKPQQLTTPHNLNSATISVACFGRTVSMADPVGRQKLQYPCIQTGYKERSNIPFQNEQTPFVQQQQQQLSAWLIPGQKQNEQLAINDTQGKDFEIPGREVEYEELGSGLKSCNFLQEQYSDWPLNSSEFPPQQQQQQPEKQFYNSYASNSVEQQQFTLQRLNTTQVDDQNTCSTSFQISNAQHNFKEPIFQQQFPGINTQFLEQCRRDLAKIEQQKQGGFRGELESFEQRKNNNLQPRLLGYERQKLGDLRFNLSRKRDESCEYQYHAHQNNNQNFSCGGMANISLLQWAEMFQQYKRSKRNQVEPNTDVFQAQDQQQSNEKVPPSPPPPAPTPTLQPPKMSVYGIPDFKQLNLAAELCAEIKTRLPNRSPTGTIHMEDILVFLENKILYHDQLDFTIQIQADGKLHCNCEKCTNNPTRDMTPDQLHDHLGFQIITFKLMVKLQGEGICLGDMLEIINTELIDTHVGHCCECRCDGDLICCDGCPLSYHSFCVGMNTHPSIDWYCAKCVQQGRYGKKRQIPSFKSNSNSNNNNNQFLVNNNIKISYRINKNLNLNSNSNCSVPSKRKSDSQICDEIMAQQIVDQKKVDKDDNKFNINVIDDSNADIVSQKSTFKTKARDINLFSRRTGILEDGQTLFFRRNQQNVLQGSVMLTEEVRGIICECCHSIISMHTFGKHANLKKPEGQVYDFVFTEDGQSLQELIEEYKAKTPPKKQKTSQKQQKSKVKQQKIGLKDCSDEGKELNLENFVECQNGFDLDLNHGQFQVQDQDCDDDEFCPFNKNNSKKKFKLNDKNTTPSRGRQKRQQKSKKQGQKTVLKEKLKKRPNLALQFKKGKPSTDPRTKLIVKRFQGMIHEISKVPSCCYLCKQEQFDRDFSDLTIILCDQCEREFHVGCLRDHNICNLTELPKGEWYCSYDCVDISERIQDKLRLGEFEYRDDSVQGQEEGQGQGQVYRVRFLRGARQEDEWETPVHEQQRVLDLFRDSFDPIKDGISGVDLVPYMVKSQSTEDGAGDFSGMCVMQLKQNNKLLGAAVFRVFGETAAEVPLVAVRTGHRGQGHCRTMMTILENLFRELEIKEMVLPAAPGTFKMWQEKFGCRPLGFTHAKQLRFMARFMCFLDCTMVYKYLTDDPRPEYEDENIDDILALSDQQVEEILEQHNLLEKFEQQQKQQQQQEPIQQQEYEQQQLEKQVKGQGQEQEQEQVQEQDSQQEASVKSQELGDQFETEIDVSDIEADEQTNSSQQLCQRQTIEFFTPKTCKQCDSELNGFTKDSTSSSKEVALNFDDTPIKAENCNISNDLYKKEQNVVIQIPRLVELQDMQHLPEYLQKSNNNTYRSICIIKNVYEEDQFVKQLLGESCDETVTTSSENEGQFQSGQEF